MIHVELHTEFAIAIFYLKGEEGFTLRHRDVVSRHKMIDFVLICVIRTSIKCMYYESMFD